MTPKLLAAAFDPRRLREAGMRWNDNVKVCGGKEAMAQPETKTKKKK